MMLIEETPVPHAALPLEPFKAHLRLATGFGTDAVQDEVLEGFLRAAIASVEARTGKVLISRTYSWSETLWRDAGGATFPVAPVEAITEVERVARDGTRTVVDATSYWLEQDSQRPRLRPVGASLPSIPTAGSVVVSFVAGFGADWNDLPADLRQAVLLLAAHYYEFRNETALSDGCMPFGVTSLIERYKVHRLGFGGTR
ncbi:MAG: head-tail connector protein [Pseudomonadota bacterium]